MLIPLAGVAKISYMVFAKIISVADPPFPYSLFIMINFQKIGSVFTRFFPPSEKTVVTIENAALVVWVFAVVASTLTHELWRDETREYLMAVGIHNFADYFNFAKYDGHPLLWRTILMAMHAVIPHPVALQMASLSIGFFTVYLIVKHSPFPLIIKVLFIFGVIPFSVNTVDARDYGISMLLFFLLAIFSTKTKSNPVLIGVLLFLEANTNQYGMYLSGLFLAGWIADSGFHVLKDTRYLAAAAIALAGIFVSYYSTRVDAESVFVPAGHIANINWPATIERSLQHPGEFIKYILHIGTGGRDVFVVALILGIGVIRPYLGFTLFMAVFFFNVVAIAFIYPQTRHQGVLFGFVMMLYWITLHGLQIKKSPGLFKYAGTVFYTVLLAFLLPFLVHEVTINNMIVREEARVEKSTALALGKYLTTNKQLENAIIIGSPEYAIEPIAFYAKNKIYLTQEKTLRNFVKFSREFEKPANLIQLLEAAEELNGKYKVPIVIALGYFDVAEEKTFATIYRGTFNTDNLDLFKEKTIKLAEFNDALCDERFQVFLYLPPDELRSYRNKYMELR